jgi:integrase/recombinase XerC
MRLKPSTVDLYRRGLSHLTAWCDSAKVKNLPDLGIEKLRIYRETWTCRPVTAARRIDRLKIFLGFCLESGWIQKNPAKSLKPPEVKVIGKAPFTEGELQSIFEACGKLVTRGTYGKANVKRVRAFIYILRYTGPRISDAAKLEVRHVSEGKVLLRTEKTGTVVWIPIPEFAVDALGEVPRVGEFYFQTGHAKAKTVRGGWDRTIRTILTLAGVKHGSAHAFRTTLAVDLLNKGVPVETVAVILGNSPAIVMKHYAPFVASSAGSSRDSGEKPVGRTETEVKSHPGRRIAALFHAADGGAGSRRKPEMIQFRTRYATATARGGIAMRPTVSPSWGGLKAPTTEFCLSAAVARANRLSVSASFCALITASFRRAEPGPGLDSRTSTHSDWAGAGTAFPSESR